MAIPVCENIARNVTEKIKRYRELEIELTKCWNLTEIKTIPFVGESL